MVKKSKQVIQVARKWMAEMVEEPMAGESSHDAVKLSNTRYWN